MKGPSSFLMVVLLVCATALLGARCQPEAACTGDLDCLVSCRCPGETSELLISHVCTGGFCVSSYLADLECTDPCRRFRGGSPSGDDDDSATDDDDSATDDDDSTSG